MTTFGTGASGQHPSIQVADVVASAVSYVLRHRLLGVSDDPFAEELETTAVLDFIAASGSVWPNREFLESPPRPGPVGEFNRMVDWLSDP